MVACSPAKTVSEKIDAGNRALEEQNLKLAESYFLAAINEIGKLHLQSRFTSMRWKLRRTIMAKIA